ncbi:hypothetical protein EDC04DRAFT_2728329, partial [Pisolithus marmoratus]
MFTGLFGSVACKLVSSHCICVILYALTTLVRCFRRVRVLFWPCLTCNPNLHPQWVRFCLPHVYDLGLGLRVPTLGLGALACSVQQVPALVRRFEHLCAFVWPSRNFVHVLTLLIRHLKRICAFVWLFHIHSPNLNLWYSDSVSAQSFGLSGEPSSLLVAHCLDGKLHCREASSTIFKLSGLGIEP